MSEMLLSAAENTETAAEGESSWTQTIAAMFEQQWWVFLITLAVVIGVMLLIKILTKGKVFKFRTIIKVALNCIIAFVLLFIINTIGSLFGFALVPKW